MEQFTKTELYILFLGAAILIKLLIIVIAWFIKNMHKEFKGMHTEGVTEIKGLRKDISEIITKTEVHNTKIDHVVERQNHQSTEIKETKKLFDKHSHKMSNELQKVNDRVRTLEVKSEKE